MPVTPPAACRSRAVLVAEDEDGVREFVRVGLTHAGYPVVTAADGDEAVAHFRADPDRFGLVLTDVLMPGRTGPEAVRAIRAVRPDVPVVYMSAFTGGPAGGDLLPPGAVLLDKPFTLGRLLAVIAATSPG